MMLLPIKVHSCFSMRYTSTIAFFPTKACLDLLVYYFNAPTQSIVFDCHFQHLLWTIFFLKTTKIKNKTLIYNQNKSILIHYFKLITIKHNSQSKIIFTLAFTNNITTWEGVYWQYCAHSQIDLQADLINSIRAFPVIW